MHVQAEWQLLKDMTNLSKRLEATGNFMGLSTESTAVGIKPHKVFMQHKKKWS